MKKFNNNDFTEKDLDKEVSLFVGLIKEEIWVVSYLLI